MKPKKVISFRGCTKDKVCLTCPTQCFRPVSEINTGTVIWEYATTYRIYIYGIDWLYVEKDACYARGQERVDRLCAI